MKAVHATSRALRQANTARSLAFRATAVKQQQQQQARQNTAGHVLPASGEQFTAPLGQEFNMNKSKMFCNQCSQHTTNCATVLGQCNKTPQVAHMQDEVVQIAVEMGYYAHTIRVAGMEVPAEVNHFMLRSMFSTLTNVNNDPVRMSEYVRTGMSLVEKLKSIAGDVPKPALPPVSILAQRWMAADKNAASVCEMLMYGLKGLCAYADHALVLGREDPRIYAFVQEALAFLASPARDDLGQALAMCLRCGEANLWTMELLYEANTASLGTPEPTKVQVRPVPGKCVLVSGHDLHVLEGLLAACEPRGVKVYTHGEMLPGHAYPRLKAYASLAGHFGGAWNKQAVEFRHFPGPIVMTSNCLTEPQKAYKDSLFTFGPVGWPGVAHLGEEAEAIKWDKVVVAAERADGFPAHATAFGYASVDAHGQPSPAAPLTVGFGHEAVLGAAGTVLAGIEAGAISRFFLIGGCDGDAEARNYYTELAESVPESSVILTLGCGKFRISDAARARLGNVGDTGIPRVLDLGQCNDTFSAIKIAAGLADALKCKVSDLPLSIVLSWYEQKAIAVLLTCLHLGLRPVRIGPVLPAFLTQDVLDVLVRDFGVQAVGAAADDLGAMTAAPGAS